jgi:hypothetical protein
MSTGPENQSGGSWLPKSNSVNAANPEISEVQDFGVPAETVDRARERTEEFIDEYPERARQPLTAEPGETLLSSYVVEEFSEETVDPHGEFEDAFTVERQVRGEPVTWAGAFYVTLVERHRYDEGTYGRFLDTQNDETFDQQFTDSWTTEYANEQRAKNAGAQRQLMGGEYPEDNPESERRGEFEPGEWDRPATVLLTHTGSSVPDGERLPPVDHARQVDTWTGDCYDRVRNLIEIKFGVPSDRWGYIRAEDPHGVAGEPGENAGYTHTHPVVYFDLETANIPGETVGDFVHHIQRGFEQDVRDKHVDECPVAAESAHGHGAVEVRIDDLDEPGGYASAYALPGDEEPLIDRSVEYIAWATTLRAMGRQRIARSKLFTDAAKADYCKQHDQVTHGDRLRYDRGGHSTELVCAECGSPVGVGETMTEHRLSADASGESDPVATDGGVHTDESESDESGCETAVVGARIGEEPARAELRARVEEHVERHDIDEVTPALLGELMVPPEHEDIVRDAVAGEPPPGVRPVEGERRETATESSQYQLLEIRADTGDTKEDIPAGGGARYVETVLPETRLLQETRLRHVGNKGRPKIRVHVGDGGAWATYNPETAARALVNAGARRPWQADRLLSFEQHDSEVFDEPVPRHGLDE